MQDSLIIEARARCQTPRRDYGRRAGALGAPIIDAAAVVAWTNESSAIAELPDVQYCVQVLISCW
jgi:hypothetical protein